MATQTEYTVAGIRVVFPHRAYGPQVAYMGKVLAALQAAHSTGHGNALLESPTGSGKTLALLCATLAWQQHCKEKLAANLCVQAPPKAAAGTAVISDNYLVTGGGFMPEPETQGCENGNGTVPLAPVYASEKKKVPKIIYTTRTHSQIAQVVQELRKTTYRVPMAVLAARKHYCTNETVCKKKNYDEDCKLLLKSEEKRVQDCSPRRGAKVEEDPKEGCRQYRNVNKVKMHPSLQQGGRHQVHDIEDLVSIGNEVTGCAYFASRGLAEAAQIVFCPYNYVVDPLIRSAMQIDIKGAIVIMDEAHNIEDVAREAGSFTVEVSHLADIRTEFANLISQSMEDGTKETYEPLLEMLEGILGWADSQANSLQKLDSSTHASWWSGGKALDELRTAGIRLELFSILLQCCRQVIKAVSDPKPKLSPPSGRAAIILEGLFCVLNFMLEQDARRIDDYQLVLKNASKLNGTSLAESVYSISFWCLNPAVVFEELGAKCQSIILTSGTLSPMGSFASELGVNFIVQIEAPHVVDMNKQVWAAAIGVGPGRVTLNASYKNTDTYEFQDGLGVALLEILQVIPDGTLVFFPSYKLLEKLVGRWKSTGQWKRLQSEKKLFVEPRGSQDAFEDVLSGYYNAVNGVQAPGFVSKSRQKNARVANAPVFKPCSSQNQKGAVFFAVFRGKVSEGLNFADKNARAVVVVGIPFPNIMDLQVKLKKLYNTQNKYVKNLLGGDEWYCQQAFRALNQAVGRCIRHRNDYGAIILLDERLQKQENINYMSKWLRNSVRRLDSFQHSLIELGSFFQNMKVQTEETVIAMPSTATGAVNSSSGHHTAEEKGLACEATIKRVRIGAVMNPATSSAFSLGNVSGVANPSPLLPRRRRKFPESSHAIDLHSSAAGSDELVLDDLASLGRCSSSLCILAGCPATDMVVPPRVHDVESDEDDDFFCTQAPSASSVLERSAGDTGACGQASHGPRLCASQAGRSDCWSGWEADDNITLSDPHNSGSHGNRRSGEEEEANEWSLQSAVSPPSEIHAPTPLKAKLKLPRR